MFLTEYTIRRNTINEDTSINCYEDLQKAYYENEMQMMNAIVAMIRLEHEAIMTNNIELLNEGTESFFDKILINFKKALNYIGRFFIRILNFFKGWIGGNADSSDNENGSKGPSHNEKRKYAEVYKVIIKNFNKYREQIKKVFDSGVSSKYYRDFYLDGTARDKAITKIKEVSKIVMDKDPYQASGDNIEGDENKLKEKASEAYKELEETKKIHAGNKEKMNEVGQRFDTDILGTTAKIPNARIEDMEKFFTSMHNIFVSKESLKDSEIIANIKATNAKIEAFEKALKDNGWLESTESKNKQQIDSAEKKHESNIKIKMILKYRQERMRADVQGCLGVSLWAVKLYKKYQDYDMACRTHWCRGIYSINAKEEVTN